MSKSIIAGLCVSGGEEWMGWKGRVYRRPHPDLRTIALRHCFNYIDIS